MPSPHEVLYALLHGVELSFCPDLEVDAVEGEKDGKDHGSVLVNVTAKPIKAMSVELPVVAVIVA